MELYKESKIDGEFRGWSGRGTYKMINGQYWQQTTYKYSYKYKYRPKARVWRNGPRHYLEVEGMSTMVPVRRVYSMPEDDEK